MSCEPRQPSARQRAQSTAKCQDTEVSLRGLSWGCTHLLELETFDYLKLG